MTKTYRGSKEYQLVLAELITASKYRGTVTYQEVAKLLGWPLTGQYMGTEIGRLLGEISEDEVEHGKPMLSAIVTTREGIPGPGFFELARRLGRLSSNQKDDELAFWKKECQNVYHEWRTILPKAGTA